MRQKSLTQIKSRNDLYSTQRNQASGKKSSLQNSSQQPDQRQFLFHTQISYRKMSKEPLKKPFNIELARQQINKTFDQLNSVVKNIQQHIERRMTLHEQNLVSMLKLQIERMGEDIRKVVQEYNQMIKVKNKDQQLFKLKIELRTCKAELENLSIENRQLRKEIKQLKRIDRDKTIDLQASQKNAQKLMKKVLKFRMFGDINNKKQKLEMSSIKEIVLTEGNENTNQYFQSKSSRKQIHTQRKVDRSSLKLLTQQSSFKQKLKTQEQTPITHSSFKNRCFKKNQKLFSHRYQRKFYDSSLLSSKG